VLQLPVDAIKIDRSIAAQVVHDARASAMVASTVELAARIGLSVTAEGIEAPAVRDRLTAAGVDWGQGFLYGPAVPGAELAGVLDRLSRGAS
jgi:EAL domain-containing protein (putative c-di-GMP-specific phosphodiesterase class I)